MLFGLVGLGQSRIFLLPEFWSSVMENLWENLWKFWEYDFWEFGIPVWFQLPYTRHYKPRLVFFFTQFSIQLRLILQKIYVLKTEILHFLSIKSAVYKQERLQIENGLWWRAYSSLFCCWITWCISSWEENNCCVKLSKFTKWHSKLSWMNKVLILSNNSLLSFT